MIITQTPFRMSFFGGGTDSAAFTQGGFRSIGITGLNHKLERFYHTRLDTPENLSPEALENCLRATAEFVCAADRDLILVTEAGEEAPAEEEMTVEVLPEEESPAAEPQPE